MRIRSVGLHGVFIGAHAVAEGFVTRRQLQDGPYVRVLHGVYADPSLPRDHLLRCRAAALLMPSAAAIGGWSAAAVWGAPGPSYGERVTVVLPAGVRWKGPQGVRVHRAPLTPFDVLASEDFVRCTTPRRTAWDVAALERLTTAVGVLDAMVRAEFIPRHDLEQLAKDGSGRWGSRKVRAAVGLVDPRSESPPESWVRVACALGRLPTPVPQFEVFHRGAFLGRVDLAWPEHKVIVEYEGAYHFDDLQITKDDARIARLVAAGWRVIRVAAHDLRDLDSLIRRIAAALDDDVPTPAL
jgi:hypothetical protein